MSEPTKEELRDALSDLYKLVSDGVLVRDTSGDGDFWVYFVQASRIVEVVKRCETVLDKTRG